MNNFNETILSARYAHYLTLCLRAALMLNLTSRHDKGNALRSLELATLLEIDHLAGRSFFNVLVTLGILTHESSLGYSVSADAHVLLEDGQDFTLRPYLEMGMDDDQELIDFVAFLKDPMLHGLRLYSESNQRCLMDDTSLSKAIANGLGSRARRFAPSLAKLIANRLPDDQRVIMDVGAGTAFVAGQLRTLLPNSRILLADRPNAMSCLRESCTELNIDLIQNNAIEIMSCDIFDRGTLPVFGSTDLILLSNVLHDWAPEQIKEIVGNLCKTMKPNAMLLVHEAFLDFKDTSRAPWMSSYGMALNMLTAGQGSCYSTSEYAGMLKRFNLRPCSEPIETTDGCKAVFYQLG
jgi:hypothetical protein